ncbi:MAG: hypothetical protein PHN75_21300, partial [Syntrophales bacterium]|nr:hypothetical protein [Syntrophales bacterium]
MKPDVILEFMDGRRLEATLAQPFVPDENEIKVTTGKNQRVLTFTLASLCCIRMIPRARQMVISNIEQTFEEVVTATGAHYHVTVIKDQDSRNGFYGLSTDIGDPFKLIFFTVRGLKIRKEERYIGEILEGNGLVTRSSIDKALEEQTRLRNKILGHIISEEHDVPLSVIENAIETARQNGKIPPRMRVGDILVEAGLVTKEQVAAALMSQAMGKKKRIGTLLIENGMITEDQLLAALAVKFRMRFVDLDQITPTKAALESLSADVVYSLKVLPLEDDGIRVVVATSEPTDYSIPDSLRFYTKRRVELVVARSQQISSAIIKYYPKMNYKLDEIIHGLAAEKLIYEQEQEEADVSESDSQIVSLVNNILMEGYDKGA